MPHSSSDEAPYWVTVPAQALPRSPFDDPPPPAPLAWVPPPAPVPRGPSTWCTAALALALLSAVVLAAQGHLYGPSVPLSVGAVLLSFVALTTTWDDAPTNRWMAVTGLVVGALPLLPYAFVFVFLWLLLYGGLG